MRYVLYLFTLGLVFTTGMLVGNFYLPAHNASLAAAVSVPDLDRANPALDAATVEQAQENLRVLTQALTSCPVVVEAEKERLFNQISLFLTLQDFQVKKSAYEAEIAKNVKDSRATSRFLRAAADYSAAKINAEQLADSLFPPAQPEQTPAQEPLEAQTQTITGQQTPPSTATAAAGKSDKKAPAEKQTPAEASKK